MADTLTETAPAAAAPDTSCLVAPPGPERCTATADDRLRPGCDAARRAALEVRTGVSLIIPALNEEAGLAKTIRHAQEILDRYGDEYEVLVVDDGSSDRTPDVAHDSGARLIQHLYGRGYGHALRSGILAARHDSIVITDADGTYPMERIPDLLDTYREGYDLVIGARSGKHYRGGFVKDIARRFFRRMCESASGTRIPDANSGLRVFRRSTILPHLPMMCTGFSFTTSQTLCFMLLSRPVAFVPIDYHERIGSTKVRILTDSLRTAQYIFQMYAIFNPVKLFWTLAVFPFVTGLALLGLRVGALLRGWSGPWWEATVLGGITMALAAVLFGMGFITFGVARQRWPDAVSGQGTA